MSPHHFINMKFQLSIYGKWRIYEWLNFRLKSKIFHDPGARSPILKHGNKCSFILMSTIIQHVSKTWHIPRWWQNYFDIRCDFQILTYAKHCMSINTPLSLYLSLSLSLSLSFVQVVRICMYLCFSVFSVFKDRISCLAVIWMKNLEGSENSQIKLVLNYAICEFSVSVPGSR